MSNFKNNSLQKVIFEQNAECAGVKPVMPQNPGRAAGWQGSVGRMGMFCGCFAAVRKNTPLNRSYFFTLYTKLVLGRRSMRS